MMTTDFIPDSEVILSECPSCKAKPKKPCQPSRTWGMLRPVGGRVRGSARTTPSGGRLGRCQPGGPYVQRCDVREVRVSVQHTTQIKSRRSSSNKNESGSAEDRRRRKMWLLDTFRADTDAWVFRFTDGSFVAVEPHTWPSRTLLDAFGLTKDVKACRCYRCGVLLIFQTLTVDRIIPGRKGGTYRRNNIRPACGPCNFGHNRKEPS